MSDGEGNPPRLCPVCDCLSPERECRDCGCCARCGSNRGGDCPCWREEPDDA